MAAYNFYESPPGSGGNDGALPAQYIDKWHIYINLTQQQVVAFQSFPQDLMKYLRQRTSLAQISGVTITLASGLSIPMPTGPDDQFHFSQVQQAFRETVITSTSFTDATGTWQTLNATQFLRGYQQVT